MAKQESALRNVSEKTKDAASAASGALGQAALNVAHLALGQARAVVASADQLLHRPKRRGKAKAAGIKRRTRAGKTALRKVVRKTARAATAKVKRKK